MMFSNHSLSPGKPHVLERLSIVNNTTMDPLSPNQFVQDTKYSSLERSLQRVVIKKEVRDQS